MQTLSHPTFSFLTFNSFSNKTNFSRYSRQCENSAFRHVLPMVSNHFDAIECRGLKCQASKEPMWKLNGICCFKKLIHKNKSIREDEEVAYAISYGGLLNFMLLFGYLTLQGSQQALAGTDFAGGPQSIPFLGDLGDISTGFASAFLLIFFSELGDKTFFIAALLAARNSAASVFAGTFGALAVMTLISVGLGRTFHYVDEILPFRLGENDLPVDDIAAVCLLVYFGVSTLIDASSSDGLKAEDEQKEAELAVSEFSGNGAGIIAAASTIISTFALVFVAEWGDKSFFSTIALAAASSPLGVIGGALAGHGTATLIAVLGGSLLGTFLSEKVIAYTGGVLFLVFAAITLVEIVS
ncbi:GDT1-like protein 1, chloroplastic [Mercurialis annua]|uniref:GDT1-like protein 1, chloroplastic n=1 Tax=Mercurialis annua TaxID=3986 RepID=UPI00215FCADE|nr:GDT1-like protein 1, chloroplastic [Mercurialis annua]